MSNIETFKLHKERCKLLHLNLRSELHGEEHANAIDLKFEFDSANNMLSKLHPDLRATFYRKDDNRELIEGDHLPALRFPLLDPCFGWELEIPRTLLRVHGDTPENDIVLGGGKTNAFKVTLKEGGTVNWKFRVQFSKPSPEAIAALSRVLQSVVPVTLECRAEDDEGTVDLFDQVEKQTQQPMSAARQEAESMFAQGGTDLTLQDETTGATTSITLQEEAAAPAAGQAPAEAPKAETAEASNVAPISKGRRGGAKKVGNGANLE